MANGVVADEARAAAGSRERETRVFISRPAIAFPK